MFFALVALSSLSAANSDTAKDSVANQTYCAYCHGRNLEGVFGPALSGKRFKEKWPAASAAALFAYIKTMMPAGAPGSLSGEDYAKVYNRIAKANALPLADTVQPQASATLAIAGGGTPFDAPYRHLAQEIPPPTPTRTIWIFKLKDRRS